MDTIFESPRISSYLCFRKIDSMSKIKVSYNSNEIQIMRFHEWDSCKVRKKYFLNTIDDSTIGSVENK